jgi:hypothetical protein
MYRKRFGLTGHPMPKDAHGKTFFDKRPPYERLARSFQRLLDEPGLGVLTGEPGVGKTAAIRNLCLRLPKPDYLVIYLSDTAVSPLDPSSPVSPPLLGLRELAASGDDLAGRQGCPGRALTVGSVCVGESLRSRGARRGWTSWSSRFRASMPVSVW